MKKYKTSVSKVMTKSELLDNIDIVKLLNCDSDSKKYILDLYNIDSSSIDLDKSDISFSVGRKCDLTKSTPSINMVYYDENDLIMERFIKNPEAKDLISFEGEIYENLSFRNDDERKKFIKDNNYEELIYPETISLMHFKAKEINSSRLKSAIAVEENTKKNNGIITGVMKSIIDRLYKNAVDVKEIYITKDKNMYSVFFGAPYYYDNKTKGVSFTTEELNNIMNLIVSLDSGYFLIYVKNAILAHQKTIEHRGYKRNKRFLSNDTIEEMSYLLENNSIDPNTILYTKVKVISNNPIELIEKEEKEEKTYHI